MNMIVKKRKKRK